MITRTERQHRIDRALIEVLLNIGDFLLPESTLRAEVSLLIPHIKPATSEIDSALRHADTTRRIIGIPTETGTKYKLTDTGRAYAAEEGIS